MADSRKPAPAYDGYDYFDLLQRAVMTSLQSVLVAGAVVAADMLPMWAVKIVLAAYSGAVISLLTNTYRQRRRGRD